MQGSLPTNVVENPPFRSGYGDAEAMLNVLHNVPRKKVAAKTAHITSPLHCTCWQDVLYPELRKSETGSGYLVS